MKKMIDAISGKEDIKVKNIVTENIVFGDYDAFIKQDNNNNTQIENTNEGIRLVNAYGFEIYMADDGFVFLQDNSPLIGIHSDELTYHIPICVSPYTTAERPLANEGTVIYDSTLKKCILYNGTAWVNLDGTALA